MLTTIANQGLLPFSETLSYILGFEWAWMLFGFFVAIRAATWYKAMAASTVALESAVTTFCLAKLLLGGYSPYTHTGTGTGWPAMAKRFHEELTVWAVVAIPAGLILGFLAWQATKASLVGLLSRLAVYLGAATLAARLLSVSRPSTRGPSYEAAHWTVIATCLTMAVITTTRFARSRVQQKPRRADP